MTDRPKRDWDDAYANMAHIPGSEALPAQWAAEASAYQASGVRIDEDIAYGDHPRERFDLVHPDGDPKGLVVFVHGGYWVRLDKSYWTHFAEGLRASGWAVAMVQYTLAPEARIGQITRQIGAAIAKAAELIDGPIRLAGHSAGGHLVSRMVCADSPLSEAVMARVVRTVSISGLHDLRPLMWTEMNADLRLDEAEAVAESAVLQRPHPNANITAWVGGGERPEFIRQSQLLALMWEGLGATVDCVVDGSHDHFTVLDGLRDAQGALTQAILA
ncbi:alpha/beta hydrolase [Cognatishimia sp. MH4019]|uniref:alpha/beta hydrolase n=1 Tax=Cognatishimia sp. MH4019 TaxID=2854030 RepID=UPI001CD1AEE2|nr:alpha/beta hydrolase [Cognatishimia sp. MH4019]